MATRVSLASAVCRLAAYPLLSHVSEVHPAQLFLLFMLPNSEPVPAIHVLRYDYADLFWFTRTLDVLNQALALARAGRFPGGWSALRAMGSLAQLGAVIRQVGGVLRSKTAV